MEHHNLITLLAMARLGRPSPHMESCSFCREQYDLALDLLSATEEIHEGTQPGAQREEHRRQSASYRLAAQTADTLIPQFRLRRTWYLKNNAVILRVIEDTQRQSLTGFFIAERFEDQKLRIRFDGIEREFIPDNNGVFEIGAASIDIEPMNVILLA